MDDDTFLLSQRLTRKGTFGILLVITLILMVCNNVINAPLTTPEAPYGIISFEFARTSQKAESILASWDELTRLHAALGLGFDYLFMPAYAATIGLACLMAADVIKGRRWPLPSVGFLLWWGLWLAALLDAIENVGLINILFGDTGNFSPALSYWCALIKFGLVFLGLIYAFYGVVVRVVIRN